MYVWKIGCKVAHIYLLVFLFSACISLKENYCNLLCEFGINQRENIDVLLVLQNFEEGGLVSSYQNLTLEGRYERDRFSNVLETTTTIPLTVNPFPISGSELVLYIGNLGSATNLDNSYILEEDVEYIRIFTDITVYESVLYFGIPDGGEVLPFYLNGIDEINPCPDRSHYIAYYNEEGFIVQAEVERPVIFNLFSAKIEIIYPIGTYLSYSDQWIGRFETMDHTPCTID